MHKLKSRPCRVLGNRDGEGGDEGTGQGCFPPPRSPAPAQKVGLSAREDEAALGGGGTTPFPSAVSQDEER